MGQGSGSRLAGWFGLKVACEVTNYTGIAVASKVLIWRRSTFEVAHDC